MSDLAANKDRLPRSFYVVAFTILVYVAACTGQRDRLWGADAWEYHRAVLALTEQLWNPGNPTYDTAEPSARYSPYAVMWAVFSRMTRIDPYQSLSIAAVVNTALLIFGSAALLRTYGDGRSATAGVVVMFALWGATPGFTCSYALTDLPWIGVNSSAFSFGVTVWMWALFRKNLVSKYQHVATTVMVFMSAAALLDHAIIGGLAQLGLWLFALTSKPHERLRQAMRATIIGIAAATLCLIWPWYEFSRLFLSPMPAGMLPRALLERTLFVWCFPAVVCGLLALLCRDRKVVRVFLLAGVICYFSGLGVWLMPKWVPLDAAAARLPLPGLLFFHLAIGVFAHRYGVFDWRTWPDRIRRLMGAAGTGASQATLEVIFGIVLVYCLIPQIGAILDKPHVARAYVAPWLGKQDKWPHLKRRFDSLLAIVGRDEVVLSDALSSWPIPSSSGKIVWAMHPEWFSPDEPAREQQMTKFFKLGTSRAQRLEILQIRNVKWILLNRRAISRRVHERLYCQAAVVAQDGELTLMDAGIWRDKISAHDESTD